MLPIILEPKHYNFSLDHIRSTPVEIKKGKGIERRKSEKRPLAGDPKSKLKTQLSDKIDRMKRKKSFIIMMGNLLQTLKKIRSIHRLQLCS